MADKKVKRTFRETRIYPIFFMIIITIIFIGILSTFYQLTVDQVRAYRQMKLHESILTIFAFPAQNIEKEFSQYIIEQEVNELKYYKAVQDSVLLGFCFPIRGKGLWGKIDALLGLSSDLEKIIGFEILDQNETPGLGGRIGESWFKDQFQNKIMVNDGIVQSFQMLPEGENTDSSQINQVTGATASSKAVVDMLTQNVKEIIAKTGDEL